MNPIVTALFHALPPCKEISALASKALDTRLRLKERLQLRTHLFICAACRRFNRQIQILHIAMTEGFGSELTEESSTESTSAVAQQMLPHESRKRIQKAITEALHYPHR